jgi:hypothetical protein
MPVCDVCGKVVKDLRRHLARGRCSAKHRKKSTILSRYVPDTPQQRLAMDVGTFSDMDDDAPADSTGAHKRMTYEKRLNSSR